VLTETGLHSGWAQIADCRRDNNEFRLRGLCWSLVLQMVEINISLILQPTEPTPPGFCSKVS
jgi:hypothetical protein